MTAIPLSTLRPDFERRWPLGSRWTIPTGQTEHGSVEQPTGSALGFRLRNAGGSRLRARVSLTGSGAARPSAVVRVKVVVLTGAGARHVIWSGLLSSIAGRESVGPANVDAVLPTDDGPLDLLLCASSARPRERNIVRLRWQDPVLKIPPDTMGARSREHNEAPARPPADLLISVLTPVHDPEPRILNEMLDSVRGQTFPGWELCMVDDGSRDPEVVAILDRAAASDERIRLERHETAGGISVATNTALAMARGEFVALLDHDDVLAPNALETVARTIAAEPEVDMVYSDEDVIDEGRRVALFRKPSWSPDLMRSHMYTCHLGVYRRALVNEVGGFRPEFDGSQDYDLVLRISERTDRIVHIPQILYHWRSHEGSVAENLAAKPHAYAAARRAIAEHLQRSGVEGEVHFDAQRCWYRIDYPEAAPGPVALILPLAGSNERLGSALAHAVASWSRTPGPSWELVLAGTAAELERAGRALGDDVKLRQVEVEPGISSAAALNHAITATEVAQLVLLKDPVEPLTSNWLARLASVCVQPGIGAVGAKTLAADGRVEHAGAIIRDGFPTPVQLAADQIEPGPMAVLQVTGNFAAVTGTVALSRETLTQLGGLDESLGQLAVADLTLRAWSEGLRVVSSPNVVVRRTDTEPALNDLAELGAFRKRWRGRLGRDPYFGERAAAVLTGVGAAI